MYDNDITFTMYDNLYYCFTVKNCKSLSVYYEVYCDLLVYAVTPNLSWPLQNASSTFPISITFQGTRDINPMLI